MSGIYEYLKAGVFALALFVPAASFAATELETIMWELVQSEDDLANVETFIENFPDSEHIEEAKEIAERLRVQQDVSAMDESIFEIIGSVTYTTPLAFGNEHTIGRSLAELITTSPAFPPIEGLPDELWKDRTCSTCHQWTRDDFCSQASTYVSKDPKKYREKMHPFGGMMKINMRNWAQNGCE